MAANYNITKFHKGEGLGFTAALKNRSGTALSTPASQTVTIRFGASPGGADILEFASTPQVELTDSGNSVWTFSLAPADLTLLTENKQYYYNIWSQLSGESPILQVIGSVRLLPSIE